MPSFNIPDKSSYKLILEYLELYFASQWDILVEKSISIELSFSNISFIAMCPLLEY